MVDVIVIGAGISGLSAALLLSEQGYRVEVLEAQDRVGGRTYTVRDPAYGGYTDLGGAYVGPTQRRVVRVARRFGLDFYKVNIQQNTVLDYTGLRMLYQGMIPPIINPFVAMDVNNFQRKIDNLANQIPAEAPWQAEKAREWDTTTVKEFVDKTCWTQFGRATAALVCKAVLCAELHEVSLLAFLWYIRSGQGLQRVINVPEGAQERKFLGGAQQLSEKMASALENHVHLSSPVIRVDQKDGNVVKVITANGKNFEAKYIISALPLALLNRVTFLPPLPPAKLQLIQRIPMGSIIKTMTFYDKPHWKNKKLSGQMMTDRGPILYCLDDTKPDGSAPCIMGFILADQALHMMSMTSDERKRAVAEHYAERFQCPEMRNPVAYAEKNWAEEEYSGGCYVSRFAPGVLTEFGSEIRRPFDRTYFAGTESATYWMGYMEGAIQAGERAAREILHAEGRIKESEIWQDEPPIPDWPEKPFEPMAVEKLLPSVPKFLVFSASATVMVLAAVAAGVLNSRL